MNKMIKNKKIFAGTSERPRVSVFRSNSRISVQVIDDAAGKTVAALSSQLNEKVKPVEAAKSVGIALGKAIKDKKIKKIVFDRGSYQYHGQVKSLAEGLRESGVEF